MKTIRYPFLRAIAALVLGLILVLFPAEAANYLVITTGLVFLIPSLVSLLNHLGAPADERRFFPIVGMGGALFGLLLLIVPGFFADLLTLLLGFILLMAGLQQLVSLWMARAWVTTPAWSYLTPLLIAAAGLTTLCNPSWARSTVFVVLGIAALCYAVGELLNWFLFMRKRPLPKPTHPEPLPGVGEGMSD